MPNAKRKSVTRKDVKNQAQDLGKTQCIPHEPNRDSCDAKW